MRKKTLLLLAPALTALLSAAGPIPYYADPRIKGGEPVMGAVNGTTTAPNPLTQYVPVTDAALRAPDPNDWIMMRGNYEAYGHSKREKWPSDNRKLAVRLMRWTLSWSGSLEISSETRPNQMGLRSITAVLSNPRTLIGRFDWR